MSARDERDALAAAQTHDLLHLGRRARQHDDRRCLAQVRQRIALVGQQLHGFVQHRGRAADAAQLVEQGFVHQHLQWYTPRGFKRGA